MCGRAEDATNEQQERETSMSGYTLQPDTPMQSAYCPVCCKRTVYRPVQPSYLHPSPFGGLITCVLPEELCCSHACLTMYREKMAGVMVNYDSPTARQCGVTVADFLQLGVLPNSVAETVL